MGFAGVTGSAILRAIREESGSGIEMAYQEAGQSAFDTAVMILATAAEETYTLLGSDPTNALTVKVKGEQFYEYLAGTGLGQGESLNG